MIKLSDKPKFKASQITHEVYNFLFWLARKEGSFLVEINDQTMIRVMQRRNQIFLSDLKKSVSELINLGLLYATEERIIDKTGFTKTVYMMADPRQQLIKLNKKTKSLINRTKAEELQ